MAVNSSNLAHLAVSNNSIRYDWWCLNHLMSHIPLLQLWLHHPCRACTRNKTHKGHKYGQGRC